MELTKYGCDGANNQARAILAALQYQIGDGIEASWSDQFKCYMADIKVARWENCREQGYVVYLRDSTAQKQLNIAFFEHRNSDSICAVMWEQITTNAPNIDSAIFGDVYKDKFDVSYELDYGRYYDMACWVKEQLTAFWDKSVNPSPDAREGV